jgi:pimeloyl-ACP methyl ester carboxylesterase
VYVFTALSTLLLVGLASHLGFRWWLARQTHRLAANSRLVPTSMGPVECAIRGEGPPVLIIPGCPGGYDQALLAAELLGSRELRLIAVSRPGYLRTPLGPNRTPEAQADVYAALLDQLGICTTAVVGVSGGGPSALQFALRHPDRCFALATVSAISRRMTAAEMNNCKSLIRRTLGAAVLALRLIGYRLGHSADQLGASTLPNFYRGLLRSFFLMRVNRAGLENDMAQFLHLANYSLRGVPVPTLVMHGADDSIVPHAHAEFIACQLSDVTKISIPGGGHLFFAEHRDELTPKIVDFLRKHTHSQGVPSTKSNASENPATQTKGASNE